MARAANLRYVSCDALSIVRVRRGKSFAYRLPNGRWLENPVDLARIRKLALPPAWTDVRICRDANGHLQAIGYDARGRRQYRYDARWRSIRDQVKFHQLLEFAASLPRLRRRIAQDLWQRELTRDKVLATVVSVMERTAIRVGNDRYAQENGSYGLTTLRDHHARFVSDAVEFSFRGKGGKPYRAAIRDKRLAAIVKRCRDIPGQRLFQYVDANGRYQAVTSSDVNEYLKRVSGADITAKTFRTWSATLLAMHQLQRLEVAGSATAVKRQVNEALRVVAEHLGNTLAICRKSYVAPHVVEAFALGRLMAMAGGRPARRAGLNAAECALVALLEAGSAVRVAA